jgi:hypothetical protein
LAHPFPISILAHRPNPQALKCRRVPAEQDPTGFEYPLPEEIRRLIHQDYIHPAAGSEIGQG